jgi:hypothetical protein
MAAVSPLSPFAPPCHCTGGDLRFLVRLLVSSPDPDASAMGKGADDADIILVSQQTSII